MTGFFSLTKCMLANARSFLKICAAHFDSIDF